MTNSRAKEVIIHPKTGLQGCQTDSQDTQLEKEFTEVGKKTTWIFICKSIQIINVRKKIHISRSISRTNGWGTGGSIVFN